MISYSYIFIIVFIAIIILFLFIIFKKEKYSNNPNYVEYKYKEIEGLTPGPISFEFFMTSGGTAGPSMIVHFLIDNNGKGYLGLSDLFNSDKTLNEKIKSLIEELLNDKSNSDKFLDDKYFLDSRMCNIKNCDGGGCTDTLDCFTIGQASIKFGPGQSFVNSFKGSNSLRASSLGDPWGSPKIFELGGQRYDEGDFIPQNKSKQLLISYTYEEDKQKKTKNLPVQFSNVRIVGAGQGLSEIRGSCLFILYDIKDVSISIGDGWVSINNFMTFAPRRIECQGFLWTGHFGVCTDYHEFLDFANSNQYMKINNIEIGYDPSFSSNKILIPNYDRLSSVSTTPPPQTPCPYMKKLKAHEDPTDCMSLLLEDKYVEFLSIDIWIELQENTFGGATLPVYKLGYPMYLISQTATRRFYLSNNTVFSYQHMDDSCKGLVYINTSFIDYQDLVPTDTFLQQCSFANRNFNSQATEVCGGVCKAARSFATRNSDKLSIINSTFHGDLDLNVNKLAMFNCYCLSVGDPRNSNLITNQAITISKSQTSSPVSGYNNVLTSGRIIFQNIIFVVHLSGDKIPDKKLKTLEDIANAGFLKVGSPNDYFHEETLYPFYIKSDTQNLLSSRITNFFLQNCVYYAIFTYNDKSQKPTFSSLNLNNIPNYFVDNYIPINGYNL